MGRPSIKKDEYIINNIKKYTNTIEMVGEFNGRETPTSFRCLVCDNTWTVKPDSVRNNLQKGRNACPGCAGNIPLSKRDPVQVKNKILSYGIKVLGDVVNTRHDADFECLTCGKIWNGPMNNIFHGRTGCPKCANRERLTTEIIKSRISKRNIVFMEDYSIDQRNRKYQWKCLKCNHLWLAKVNTILTNHGCPLCAENPRYNEEITGDFLEDILHDNTYIIKKNFMINEKILLGKEVIRSKVFIDYAILDGETIVCLVEYNGRQHYSPVDRFGGVEEYRKVKIRDDWLRSFCIDKNIPLVEIDGRKYYGESIKDFLVIRLAQINTISLLKD
jgi:hypothetical protein